jgi:hypothetical protein
MTDILNSVVQRFKEKTSPLYGTFILAVITINWKFFYILFWQSEEFLKIPRIEYAQNQILASQSILEHLLHFIIFPSLVTYLLIWWLPYLNNIALKKHTDFHYKNKSDIDDKRLFYEKESERKINEISRLTEARAEKEERIQNNTNEEDRWAFEIENTENKGGLYNSLQKIKEILYTNSGITKKWNSQNGNYDPVINPDILALADSKGIIEISGMNGDEKISLTPKGKFFMSRYLDNNN